MRYLLLPLSLFVLACQNDLTPPAMEPVDPPEAWAYTPYYPNAPFCEDVAGFVNGAFLVRVHSYWDHVPTQVVWVPANTAQERRLQAEVYSYTPSGQICRNMDDLVTWVIQDHTDPPLVTQFGSFVHARIKQFDHIPGGEDGFDRIIAQVGPKQTCCPVQAVAGVAADSVKDIMYGW